MSEIPQIGISIPAYRDAERLRRCLHSIARVNPSLLRATTIVDDSGDGSVAETLRSEYTEATWISNEKNLGFAQSANRAVMENSAAIVLLLNDDTELLDDPTESMLSAFANPSVFAVSLRAVDEDGRTREGAKRLVWRCGIARILHNEEDQMRDQSGRLQTDYAVGGHAVFRKATFADLGGFDREFHPFYWEDVDLCARAKAAGFAIAYCPEASVLHRPEGAIKSSTSSADIRRHTWLNRLRFSVRHASGLQRFLLPLGFVWQIVVAAITADKPRLGAIRSFLMSRPTPQTNTGQSHG